MLRLHTQANHTHARCGLSHTFASDALQSATTHATAADSTHTHENQRQVGGQLALDSVDSLDS